MGTNMHGWVEEKVGAKYIAVERLKKRKRNYRLFAMLAGERNYNNDTIKEPLGLPTDLSDTAKHDIDKWGPDGHSHSYVPLREAIEIFNAAEDEPSDEPEYEYFDILPEDIGDIDNFRLVFWFDN